MCLLRYFIYIPFIITACTYSVCIMIAILFPPITYDKDVRAKKEPLLAVIKEIKSSPQLAAWGCVSVMIGSSLSVVYMLIQPLMNEYHFSGILNGVLFGGATLCAACGSYVYPFIFRQAKSDYRQNIGILFLFIMLILCTVLITYNMEFLFFIAYFCLFRFIFGMFSPIIAAKTQRMIHCDTYRTTIVSLFSLATGIMQASLLFAAAGIPKLVTKMYNSFWYKLINIKVQFTFIHIIMCIELLGILYLFLRHTDKN